MSSIKKALYKELKKALNNNYGQENFDEYRFGNYPYLKEQKDNYLNIFHVKAFFKRLLLIPEKRYAKALNKLIEGYIPEIDRIFDNISTQDQELYKKLIIYRILGFSKVKLPRNNPEYWEALEQVKKLANPADNLNPNFLHFILNKMNLKPIGFDIQFYHTPKGIAVDFLLEQYAYKYDNERIVAVESEDIVLDLGACWGDTALYFAHEVGENGKVYSFEFIPSNIEILKRNLSMNSHLQDRVELIPNPVTDRSNEMIFYNDNGPSSHVSFESFNEQTGISRTVSIDEFVKKKNLRKIDFIKMDIEGAEMLALEGAKETIRNFQPKLAIAIYHSFEDFVKIPNWILDLNVNYQIFIDHFSIHAEETICFAIPRND